MDAVALLPPSGVGLRLLLLLRVAAAMVVAAAAGKSSRLAAENNYGGCIRRSDRRAIRTTDPKKNLQLPTYLGAWPMRQAAAGGKPAPVHASSACFDGPQPSGRDRLRLSTLMGVCVVHAVSDELQCGQQQCVFVGRIVCVCELYPHLNGSSRR